MTHFRLIAITLTLSGLSACYADVDLLGDTGPGVGSNIDAGVIDMGTPIDVGTVPIRSNCPEAVTQATLCFSGKVNYTDDRLELSLNLLRPPGCPDTTFIYAEVTYDNMLVAPLLMTESPGPGLPPGCIFRAVKESGRFAWEQLSQSPTPHPEGIRSGVLETITAIAPLDELENAGVSFGIENVRIGNPTPGLLCDSINGIGFSIPPHGR